MGGRSSSRLGEPLGQVQRISRGRGDYGTTFSFSALAEGMGTAKIEAMVGAIWRISTTPKSLPTAMFRPITKNAERSSGRSGRYPCAPVPGDGYTRELAKSVIASNPGCISARNDASG